MYIVTSFILYYYFLYNPSKERKWLRCNFDLKIKLSQIESLHFLLHSVHIVSISDEESDLDSDESEESLVT